MKENLVNLSISEDMVRPIVEKQLQAAVLAQLGNPEEIIANVVSLALHQKVNERGNVSPYASDNRYGFLDLVTADAIRKAAREALEQWLAENAQLLKQMVVAELNRPARRRSLVAAFADAAERAFKCSWNFACNIEFKQNE